MTDDEKEAIEQFKSWREYIIKHREETNQADDLEFYIRTVLNLITRLEKENKNSINKDIIRDKINERQFELQQEYKDFEDDIRLNTLQELYYYESKEE